MTVPPRTSRTIRREICVFKSAWSLPLSSRCFSLAKTTPDSDSDGSFVFVSHTSSPENSVLLLDPILDIDLPAKQNEEPTSNASRRKGRRNERSRPAKRLNAKLKEKPAEGSSEKNDSIFSPIPHPLFLRLRSTSASQGDAHLSHKHAHPSLSPTYFAANATPRSTIQNSIHSLPILDITATPTTPTTSSLSSPLSPLSPNMYSSDHLEVVSEQERDWEEQKWKNKERGRRRKTIAKLTRTLGENVPPELVFTTIPIPIDLDMPIRSNSTTARKSSIPYNLTRSRSQPMFRSTSFSATRVRTDVNPVNPLLSPALHAASASVSSASLVQSHYPSQERKNVAPLTLTRTEKKRNHTSRHMSLSVGSGTELLRAYAEVGTKMRGADVDGRYDEGNTSVVDIFEEGATISHPHLQFASPLEVLSRSQPGSVENMEYCSASCGTIWGQQYLKKPGYRHSNPSLSPDDGGVLAKSDNPSESLERLSPTPLPTRISTPTPTISKISKLPALLSRKLSTSKSQVGAGGKASQPHYVKSKGLDLVEEMFGTRITTCEEPTRAQAMARSSTPSNDCPPRSVTPHPVPLRSGTPHLQACGRRKELGWSGEWNRGDMEEVVSRLRDLKAR